MAIHAMAKGTVELAQKEEKIFHLLLAVLRHFDLDSQIRVATGWAVNVHAASDRFISLIPLLEGDAEIVESELEDEYLDSPLTCRRRVLAGPDNVWKSKPLLDAHVIMKFLQLKKGSPTG